MKLRVYFFRNHQNATPPHTVARPMSALGQQGADAEGWQEVELDDTHLFDNQFNTTDGRRLFDWYTRLITVQTRAGVASSGCGHWLDTESLETLNELRRARYQCGYCGHQTDTPAATDGWCHKCLGSPYLEGKDLHLLQLLPVLTEAERSESVPPELMEQYQAVRAKYEAKQGDRLAAERAKYARRREQQRAAFDRETAAFMALYNSGVDPSKAGAVYYGHTDTLMIGAITTLDGPTKDAIRGKLANASIPCRWDIKS